MSMTPDNLYQPPETVVPSLSPKSRLAASDQHGAQLTFRIYSESNE